MTKQTHRDFTCTFKPFAPWQPADALPAYSYDKPSTCFWNGFMKGLIDAGFSEAAAQQWVMSKAARWMFDGDMSEIVEKLAYDFAKKNAEQYASKKECAQWAKANRALLAKSQPGGGKS